MTALLSTTPQSTLFYKARLPNPRALDLYWAMIHLTAGRIKLFKIKYILFSLVLLVFDLETFPLCPGISPQLNLPLILHLSKAVEVREQTGPKCSTGAAT